MPKFRTQFDEHKPVKAVAGSAVKDEYIGRYDAKGRIELIPNGKTNMYEYIQSFKDSCDINVILKKYQNGDIEALSRVQGMYADISDMPKTFADMLNKVKAGEEFFDSLPIETRELFGHNVAEWFAQIGTPDWCEAMGVEPIQKPEKKSKKKAEEAAPATLPTQEGSDS